MDLQTLFTYYPTPCTFTRKDKDDTGSPYLTALFSGTPNTPNIVIPAMAGRSAAHYQSERLYITGPVYSAGDGELTIIHAPTTTRADIAVSIFTLRTVVDTKPGEIDAILSMDDITPELDLSPYIEANVGARKQTGILADGRECILWIHPREIKISKDISGFSKTALFTKTPTVRNIADTNTSIIEGMEDPVYECENLPMDSTDNVQVYEIPINSDLIAQGKMGEATAAILQVLIFMMVSVILFLATPTMYGVIRNVYYKDPNNEDKFVEKASMIYKMGHSMLGKKMDPTPLGCILFAVFMVVSFIAIVAGAATANSLAVVWGVYIGLASFLALFSSLYHDLFEKVKPQPV